MGAQVTTLDLSKSYAGTCQACFNVQVTKNTGGRGQLAMVLHGYSRPGHGWIVGDCAGHGVQPYELSCEHTKMWRDTVALQLARTQVYLARLRADEVDELRIEVDVPRAKRKDRWARETKSIVIGRDWVDPNAKQWAGKPHDFQWHRQNKISEQEMHERQMASTIKFLNEKITAWKYAPELLVEHDTYVANATRKSKEEAAAAKATRNATKTQKAFNLAFRYVGQAISRHKKGCRNGNYSGATFEKQLEDITQGFNIWTTDDFTDRSTSARHTQENRVKDAAELEAQSLPPFEKMYPGAAKARKGAR